jgi:beta-N-acetylhexosaminidase
VVTSIKHFPGHGDTATDSHLGLPVVLYDRARLNAMELAPFRACLAAGATSVMIAHVALPALTGDPSLPATLSHAIITDLLRNELGYDGVVISDCMEMAAVAKGVGAPQGALMTLQAGSDIALVSHTHAWQKASLANIRSALDTGGLTHGMVAIAAGRVVALKERMVGWETLPGATVPAWVRGADHQALSARAYAAAVTLARNDADLIPLRLAPDAEMLIIAPEINEMTMAVDLPFAPERFLEAVGAFHAKARLHRLPVAPDAAALDVTLGAARQAAVTVVLTSGAQRDPRQADLMRRLLATQSPSIGVAVYTPYDLRAFPDLPTYLATFEYTAPALVAAASVLFGAITPQGKLPVQIGA